MIRKYREKLKNDRKLLIICVLLILFLLTALVLFGINSRAGIKSFEIEDKCGRFINLMSHTIEDKGKCRTRCVSQCQSESRSYYDSEFEFRESGCNYCKCYCK